MQPLALEVNGVSSQLSIYGRCKEKNVKKDKNPPANKASNYIRILLALFNTSADK